MISAVLAIAVILLLAWIAKVRAQVKRAIAVLDDISNGNLDRRIVCDNSGISKICYKVNEIVIRLKEESASHKQSERAYRQLMTSLSHDLRTPMASLIGYLGAVNDGVVQGGEKEEYLQRSLSKALDLKEYVDTLFEWLKLESGERIFNFFPVDICELTREIVADWIPQIEGAGMEYEICMFEEEVRVSLDSSAYRRILNNMIQNVFTHSNAGKMKVELFSSGQMIGLSVTDNGAGIPERDLPFIFDRLYKCDTARSKRGNGLGLSIASELAKAHGGRISAESELGSWSKFTLWLPFAKQGLET
ncbi:MAG: HAMP domain-containing histidine kinase [Clostridiales bacterium]|jgi:signal transduction histidine kinase|nr:HAMP domain-containing histidine kinase [Clostridiales bacterium]